MVIGERRAALEKLKGAFEKQPGSGAIASQLMNIFMKWESASRELSQHFSILL
jgi:hypothetical protein